MQSPRTHHGFQRHVWRTQKAVHRGNATLMQRDRIQCRARSDPIHSHELRRRGVRNPELGETRNWYERGLLFLLRQCLPPHRDNEAAAEYLNRGIGNRNKHIEWCSVGPDSLINAEISPYEIVASLTTGIFTGPGNRLPAYRQMHSVEDRLKAQGGHQPNDRDLLSSRCKMYSYPVDQTYRNVRQREEICSFCHSFFHITGHPVSKCAFFREMK
jgi:hypothetical protein